MILGRGDVVRGRKPLWTFTLCGYLRSVVAEEHQRSCDLLQLLRRVDCMFGSLSQETWCAFNLTSAWVRHDQRGVTSMLRQCIHPLAFFRWHTAFWRCDSGRTGARRYFYGFFSKNSTQLILILSNRMEKVFCAVGATEEMYPLPLLTEDGRSSLLFPFCY